MSKVIAKNFFDVLEFLDTRNDLYVLFIVKISK